MRRACGRPAYFSNALAGGLGYSQPASGVCTIIPEFFFSTQTEEALHRRDEAVVADRLRHELAGGILRRNRLAVVTDADFQRGMNKADSMRAGFDFRF